LPIRAPRRADPRKTSASSGTPTRKRTSGGGPVNIPLEPTAFAINRERARDYLNTRERLYCFDGFAGWDPKYRIKVRVICSRPYHALFMHTMLIRPKRDELANFGKPDFVIYNAGAFPSNRLTPGVGSKTSIDLSLEDRELIILGSEYAGEMKKGVFTLANYFAPKRGVLSMHCSATADKDSGRSSLLFGLSGTGKTTLSADPKRHLIGDDEHCWSEDGIFNIEGGCYAKAINLTPENEPDIFNALRFGAVLENVALEEDHTVDFGDTSITENTRGAYPIEFIKNARIPCVAGHPTDVIFLTCDAFGVLPPVSRLSPTQAMYHFISGYTAKVAGTEMGVKDLRRRSRPASAGRSSSGIRASMPSFLSEKIKKHGRAGVVGEHGMDGRRVRHWPAHSPCPDARDHRRHTRRRAFRTRRRSAIRPSDSRSSRSARASPRRSSLRAPPGRTPKTMTSRPVASPSCSATTSGTTRPVPAPRSSCRPGLRFDQGESS
jgi:phosphoenolpyruvate carboxykinase (ATP)